MSLEIKQTREQFQHAGVLTKNTSIQNIRLLSSNCRRINDDEYLANASESLQVEVFFKPTQLRVLDQRLFAEISFECKVVPVPNDTSNDTSFVGTTEVLRIECVLEAVYLLKGGYTPSAEERDAFHQGNAVFNCWPYFREFVQNSAGRMDFPPPPIPFLRVSLPKKDTEMPNRPNVPMKKRTRTAN
jgi:hypothetical protein